MERVLQRLLQKSEKLQTIESEQKDPRSDLILISQLEKNNLSLYGGLKYEVWRQIEAYHKRNKYSFNPQLFNNSGWTEPANFRGTPFVGILAALGDNPASVYVRRTGVLGGLMFNEAILIKYKNGGVNNAVMLEKLKISTPVFGDETVWVYSKRREFKGYLGFEKTLYSGGNLEIPVAASEGARWLLGRRKAQIVTSPNNIFGLVEKRGLFTLLVLLPGEMTKVQKLHRKEPFSYRRNTLFAVHLAMEDLKRWNLKSPLFGPRL